MQNYSLKCYKCSTLQKSKSVSTIYCEKCKSLLICVNISDEKYDPIKSIKTSKDVGIFTLGEGNTPLIKIDNIANRLGLKNLFAKLEYISPTGSFKDRGSSLVINIAKKENIKKFVEDSSGNAGASLSAYSAACGIEAHIFVPDSAGKGKLDQISIFGANLHKIKGPRENSMIEAKKYSKIKQIPYLSHNLSPYFTEGMKSFSYEIVEELDNIDHIIFPTGNGSLLLGTWRGLLEINQTTNIKIPHLHVAQSKNIQPIVAAYNNMSWKFDSSKKTLGSGISVSNPPRLNEIVDAVKSSNGYAVSTEDEEALFWQKNLAMDEGIFSEITSAFSFSVLAELVSNKKISKYEKVVIPITGSGLKEPIH